MAQKELEVFSGGVFFGGGLKFRGGGLQKRSAGTHPTGIILLRFTAQWDVILNKTLTHFGVSRMRCR